MDEFTTWSALRTAIKNALTAHVAGSPCVGEYAIAGRTVKYRSFEELERLYFMTFRMEAMEISGFRISRGQYIR